MTKVKIMFIKIKLKRKNGNHIFAAIGPQFIWQWKNSISITEITRSKLLFWFNLHAKWCFACYNCSIVHNWLIKWVRHRWRTWPMNHIFTKFAALGLMNHRWLTHTLKAIVQIYCKINIFFFNSTYITKNICVWRFFLYIFALIFYSLYYLLVYILY